MKTLKQTAAALAGSIALLCVTAPVQAAVTWNFNFTDPVNTGFNAAGQLGTDRRNALIQAGNVVSGYFGAYNATIQMDVNGSVTDDNVLAAAGSEYSAAESSGFTNRGDVGRKILGLADPNPGGADGTVTWNFQDTAWELDSSFQANEYDFLSTAVHELIHAVGYSHTIGNNGQDPFSGTDSWAPFDQWLGDATGPVVATDGLSIDSGRWTTALTGGTGANGLFWHGPNAMAANGGNPVNMYSPDPLEEGSTGSHLDDNFFTSEQLLMEAATGPGLSARSLSAIEIGMLQDIGFTQVVPIPGAIWLMGSATVFLFGFRRRSA